MFSLIKPDKTADFEAVLARVKEALGKSSDPKRKAQALSWRVLKGLETGPGGNVVYVWLLDPAVKDEDYGHGSQIRGWRPEVGGRKESGFSRPPTSHLRPPH